MLDCCMSWDREEVITSSDCNDAWLNVWLIKSLLLVIWLLDCEADWTLKEGRIVSEAIVVIPTLPL